MLEQMDESRWSRCWLHRLIVSLSPTSLIKLPGEEADLEPGRKYAELKEAPCHDLRNVLASDVCQTLQTRP